MPTPQLSEHHQRGMERGLRPSKARPCPRVVAGRHCLALKARREGQPHLCICQRYYPLVLDHSQMWINEKGVYVLTGEPYRTAGSSDALRDFIIEVEDLGLEVAVSDDNMWRPTTTALKLITITGTERHRLAK